jgi:MoaA/NifB/PqqE/SkfB family radical SAM enzyme
VRPEPHIARLPILVLYPQGGCDCRCLMCSYWRADQRTRLALPQIEALLPDLRALRVEQVVLSGGEPLLHPDLEQIGAMLRRRGLSLVLLSNGLRLERRAAGLAPLLDELVLSLDGPRAVHDRIRGLPQAFERMRRGVAAARAANPGIRVTARCTVQRHNSGCLPQTVQAARELGLDGVSFLPVDLQRPAFNRPAGWEQEQRPALAPDAAALELLRQGLAALERDHADDLASGFIAESPQKLRLRVLGTLEASLGQRDCPPVRCNAPWISAVIEADGAVRPCFFHPPLGNIRERGLEQILNSGAGLRFRRQLDPGQDPTCRGCVCTLYRG